MIGALLGWLLPVAGGSFLLGAMFGARQEQAGERDEPAWTVERDRELAEGIVNQQVGFKLHDFEARRELAQQAAS